MVLPLAATLWMKSRASRNRVEILLAGALALFGLLMFASGPGAGVAGLVGATFLAAEALRHQSSRWLALAGILALGISCALATTERNLVLGLLSTAVLVFSLRRGWQATLGLTSVLCLTYALAIAASEWWRGHAVDWWPVVASLATLNVVSVVGHELAASRRTALEQKRALEEGLEQQVLFARDLGQVHGEARALRRAIMEARADGQADGLSLQRLVSEARRITGAESVVVLQASVLAEPHVWDLVLVNHGDQAQQHVRLVAPPGSLWAEGVGSHAGLWISDAADDPVVQSLAPADVPIQAMALLPIMLRAEPRWLLVLLWRVVGHEFGPQERQLLTALATQTGLALELAEARDELATRARGAEALHRVAAEVAGRREVRDIADSAVAALQRLYGADAGGFCLVDEIGTAVAVVAQQIDGGGLERLHAVQPAEQTNRATALRRDGCSRALAAVLQAQGFEQLVTVPAILGGRMVGELLLVHQVPRAYRPFEMEQMETFAGQMAGAIELAQAYAAVERVDREREEYISLVSHELQQPVATIGLMAQALATVSGLTSTEQHALNSLRGQARSLGRLAEDLLLAARLESGSFVLRPVTLDLTRLVSLVAGEAAAPERIHVIAGEPVFVSVDAERVGQAIDNLLRNALKYSTGPVTVEVVGDRTEARVAIHDRGIGLAPDEISQLFRKYGRVRNARTATAPGTGLGLYLTRTLVEANGGQVSAASAGPRQGSTFALTLPRVPTPITRSPAALQSAELAPVG